MVNLNPIVMAKKTKVEKQDILKIWSFAINSFDYSKYTLVDQKDRAYFKKNVTPAIIKGEKIGKTWKPLIYLKKEQRKKPDFLTIEDVGIVMTQRAIDALNPLLGKSIEKLPLVTFKQAMYFVHITESLDCLDDEKTEYRLSAVTQTKVGINKFAFDVGKIKNKHIFKIKGFWYNTFVSDEFQKICKENDLQGVDFAFEEMVWTNVNSFNLKKNSK